MRRSFVIWEGTCSCRRLKHEREVASGGSKISKASKETLARMLTTMHSKERALPRTIFVCIIIFTTELVPVVSEALQKSQVECCHTLNA